MLVRVWRKGNSQALLVGEYNGSPTLENDVEDPQNSKIELPYDPAIHFWVFIQRKPNHQFKKTPLYAWQLFFFNISQDMETT